MKTIQLMVAGLVGLMASATVSAEALNSGNNDYLMSECTLLANDIKLILSGGVQGDIACDTDVNVVAVSVCHTAGLATSRSTAFKKGDVISGTTTCDVDEGCVETVTGSAFPSASTANGTVASRYPGNDCTTDNAATETAAIISALSE